MLSGFPPLSHVQTPKLSELSRTTSLPFPRSPIPDAAKRQNESPQTPDTKRQKVSEKNSPAPSPRPPGGGAGPVGQRPPSRQVPTPSIPPSALPSQPHPQLLQPSPIPPRATATPIPSPAKPPAAPAAHLSSNAPNPNAPSTQHAFNVKVSMVVERGKALDVEINALEAKIREAQAAGNTADVESLKKDYAGKSQQSVKIKALLYQLVNRPAMGGLNPGTGGSGEMSQSQSQSQPQPQLAANNMKSDDTAPPMVSAPVSLPMEEHKQPATDQRPPVTDQQALMHFMQARSGTTGFPSPEVAALHKLPNKSSTQVPTFSGSPKPRPAHLPASGSTSQHQSQAHHQSQPQPQPQASTSASSRGPKQWEGSFTFTIQHAGQPKGLEVQVTAVTNSKGQLYVTEQSL